MEEIYRELWSKKITLSEVLLNIGSKFPERPDWCALCRKTLDTTLDVHLQDYHGVTTEQILKSSNYVINNNELLERMIAEDVDRRMSE